MLLVDTFRLYIRDYYLYGAFICALFSLYIYKLVSGRLSGRYAVKVVISGPIAQLVRAHP